MNRLFLVVAFMLSAFVLHAQNWTKTKAANVDFKIKNAGITVDGKFNDVKALIFLDEKNVSNSKFSGVVTTSSVKTGIKLRDEHLVEKSEFFNSAKFPTMELVSNKITPTEKLGVYKVEWKLTIKGVAKYITTEVQSTKKTEELLLSTTFTINRRDWGVGGKSIMMNDNVTIKLNAVAVK